MNIKVGPYYGGSEEEMIPIDSIETRARKPSVELLESVRLRPTYFSFPSPTAGRSPTVPGFRFPQYGYYSLQAKTNVKFRSSYAADAPSPKSCMGDCVDDRKATIQGTIVNFSNYFIGIGVLALPFALRLSGWCGLVTLVALGMTMCYTATLLGRCQYRFTLDSYPEIVEVAFGSVGHAFVSLIFYMQLLFEVTIFMVLLTQSLGLLLPSWSTSAVSWLSTALLIAISNLFTSHSAAKWLSIISCISITLMCVTLLSTFVANLVFEFSAHDQSGSEYPPSVIPATSVDGSDLLSHFLRVAIPRHVVPRESSVHVSSEGHYSFWSVLGDTEAFTTLQNTIRALGIFSFCYVGHAVLPSLVSSMRRPSQFPTAVNASFCIMATCYLMLGISGYLCYGQRTQSNILLNLTDKAESSLPPLPTLVLGWATIVLALCTVATKFSLASTPITESLFEWLAATCDHLIHGSRPHKQLPSLYHHHRQRRRSSVSATHSGHTSAERRSSVSNGYYQASGVASESPSPLTDDEERLHHLQYMVYKATSMSGSGNRYSTTQRTVIAFGSSADAGDEEESAGESEDGYGHFYEAEDEETKEEPRLHSSSTKLPVPFCLPVLEEGDALFSSRRSSSSALASHERQRHGSKAEILGVMMPQGSQCGSTAGGMVGDVVAAEAAPTTHITSTNVGGGLFIETDEIIEQQRARSTAQSSMLSSGLETFAPSATAKPPLAPPVPAIAPSTAKTSAVGAPQYNSFWNILGRIAIRTLLPFFSLGLCMIFPHFADLVMFVGGGFGAVISMTVPAACYLKMFRTELSSAEQYIIWAIIIASVSIEVLTMFILF